MAVFVIGHVTKEGVIAGPRVLEHIVDTVLYLEGDRFQSYRLLRSVKNRFGATSEVGVFEMRERGMVEVPNPSEAFLAERMVNVPGSAIAVTMEGTRPLLVEIQGLTSQTTLGNPRRTPNGIDINRLLLIDRGADPPAGAAPGRAGCLCQRDRRPAHQRAGRRPGGRGGDCLVAARCAGARRYRPDRRGGPVGRAAHGRADERPAARGGQAGLPHRHRPAPHPPLGGEPWPEGIQIIEARSLREALSHALIQEAADGQKEAAPARKKNACVASAGRRRPASTENN